VSINSRAKGANGEREFRDFLRSQGFSADRDGRLDWDLRHNVPGIHFEVKRRETLDLYGALAQAERDALCHVPPVEPVVVFRRSHHPWRVIVDAEFFLGLISDQQKFFQVMETMNVEYEDMFPTEDDG
jgi:Holliday junction resolvase